MELSPLNPADIPAAAELFARDYRAQRKLVPSAPPAFENPAETASRLGWMVEHEQVLGAFENGQLVGYLAWYIADQFRDTDRRGAYCPEWGHAARPGLKGAAYRALYRACAQAWTDAGCSVHTISLLAGDSELHDVWFWSGFGLVVVDAARGLDPIEVAPAAGFELRQAAPADSELLADLEAEHWQHYAAPPVFMAANWAESPQQFADFLSDPANSAWLALKDGQPAAYLRFAPHGHGSAAVLDSDSGAHCTGAFTRPAYRGSRLASALLDMAIRHYAGQGRQRMTVDFEAINPEAAVFWPRYFTPVCYSVMRIPENIK